MNKILNWTFGSLFRTIGRVFGFLIVCLLLLIIGSKLGFKLPDFLIPLKINATTLDFSVNQSLVCVDRSGTQTCTSYANNPYDANPTYPVELIKYRLKTGSGFKADSTYTINFGYKPTPDAIQVRNIEFQFSGSDDYETNFTCTGWNLNSLGYYRNVCDFTPSVDVDNSEYLYIYVRFYPSYLTTIRPSLLGEYNVVEGVGSIIKDQTNQIIQGQDQTNEKLDNIEDTLTDTSDIDISSLENAAGWLPPGPVDSILNLPFAMLNSLLSKLNSSTCSPVSLTLPFVNVNYQLPCINTLYEKIGITGTLFNTTGLIASAFILFNYLLALYKWIDDTLSLRENTMPGYFDDNWGGGM